MNIAVILFLVGSCIASSYALRCYNCESRTDANCAEEGYSKVSMKCPESNSTDKFDAQIAVCLKEVTVENGINRTIRSCATEGNQFVACSIAPTNDYCSTCKKDFCNSADRKITNLILSIVPFLTFIAF